MNNTSRSSKVVGNYGENIAVRFLKKLGHIIIDRNWRIKCGEIDIVSLRGSVIHFVEVKTVIHETSLYVSRETLNAVIHETKSNVIHETGEVADTLSQASFNPEENVHKWKLEKLAHLSESYILNNSIDNDFQIDVVAIVLKRRVVGYSKTINYFESVL